MKNNEKGIALLTTLILGLVALAFIGALLYFLTSGTRFSGTEKRYYTALEAAKGGADSIISTLLIDGDVTCNNGNNCVSCPLTPSDSCKIDLTTTTLGNYNIEAYLLGKETTTYSTVFSIRVIARNPQQPNEKAEIEFVYKIE
ncbi:hypothetical protein [Persephonella sp. IF05-L8]|uniref:hypothetical protein n=1 Tax=Persephonella sp. IF05-L8 TaxID=1158338 RepID=UPI0004966B0E